MSPRLSFKKSFRTVIYIKNPVFATLLKSFHKDIFFLFINAVKFIFDPSKKSYFRRVAINAAIILPALLPAIIVGIQSAYRSVCTTPMWYIPKIAPPLKSKALLPTACLS
jgi:flagellar biosynthesis protein FliQ